MAAVNDLLITSVLPLLALSDTYQLVSRATLWDSITHMTRERENWDKSADFLMETERRAFFKKFSLGDNVILIRPGPDKGRAQRGRRTAGGA
jgi:hypothetical protein